MKKNKGFTLVELIIVVAIIAIIAGVVGVSLIKYVQKARRAKDVQYAGEIQEAVDRAIIDTESGTKVAGLNWKNSVAVAWNKDSKLSDNPDNVLEYAFKDLGRMPECNTNKNWFWVVTFDSVSGKVKTVSLTPSLGSDEVYELWPDYEDFLEKKEAKKK